MKFMKKYHLVEENQMKAMKNQANDKPDKEQILKYIPRGIKNKAEVILDSFDPKTLSWDKQLSLIYKGNPIPGSNIVDCIRGTCYDYKKTIKGQKEFSAALKEQNIPDTYLPKLRNIKDVSKNKSTHLTRTTSRKEPSKRSKTDCCTSANRGWIKL